MHEQLEDIRIRIARNDHRVTGRRGFLRKRLHERWQGRELWKLVCAVWDRNGEYGEYWQESRIRRHR